MTDEIDRAQQREQEDRDRAIAAAGKHDLDPGVPGECARCGEWSGRLINAACPYRKVAHATEMATCSMDAQVIQELLGLPVEQVARLVDGEVRCEYLVRVPAMNENTAPQTVQTGVTTG